MWAASAEELETATATTHVRYHAFDALRATMMMLGLVLHAACNYTTFPMGRVWAFKDQQTSHVADVILLTIHTFRMPVFMVMAGFFAALLAQERSVRAWIEHRVQRILVPFVVSFLVLIPLTKWAAFYAVSRAEGAAEPVWEGLRRALEHPFLATVGHLWFLYDLLLFNGVVALVRPLFPGRLKQAVTRTFSQAMGRGWGYGVGPFFAVTSALCCSRRDGTLGTSTGFVPNVPVLCVHFLFFGFGWLLYAERARLPSLKTRLLAKGGLMLALIAVQIAILAHSKQLLADPGLSPWLVASAAAGMGAAWVGLSFWVGLFLRYFEQPKRGLRYLTDASYAVYLVHVPLAFLVAGWISPWHVAASLKLSVVLVAIATLSLVIYATCVRSTFIGQSLNGRRYS
jgi:glucans biosynthesis protein C